MEGGGEKKKLLFVVADYSDNVQQTQGRNFHLASLLMYDAFPRIYFKIATFSDVGEM